MSAGDVFTFIGELLWNRRVEFAYLAGYVVFEFAVRSRAARRLAMPGYLLDLLYGAMYRLGIYAVLIDRPINDRIFAHLSVPVIAGTPVWFRVIVYVLLLDFVNYWVHRVEHAVPALWAFHQVHHSQEHLSIMATYRNHPLDFWMRGFFAPALCMILVGLPPSVWVWLAILWDVTLNLSHLEVDWTYGPFRWLFVSPVSHAIHHSVEERHQQRNFGANLAIWDRLFGTADLGTARPVAVGLPGWTVRESILAHFWAPVRRVVRHYRGLPMDELVALERTDATMAAPDGSLTPDSPSVRP